MAETQTLKTLQRVIFPSAVETDVVPLYVDAGVAAGVQLPTRIDGDATTSITEATQVQEQAPLISPLTEPQLKALSVVAPSTLIPGKVSHLAPISMRSQHRIGAVGPILKRSY